MAGCKNALCCSSYFLWVTQPSVSGTDALLPMFSWRPADCLTLLWHYTRTASGHTGYTFGHQSNKTDNQLEFELFSTDFQQTDFIIRLWCHSFKNECTHALSKKTLNRIKLVPRFSCACWLLSEYFLLLCNFVRYKPQHYVELLYIIPFVLIMLQFLWGIETWSYHSCTIGKRNKK